MPRDTATLETLCASIERAWRDQRDPTAADRLAAQYPDDAPYFYAFLAGLLAGELGIQLPADAMRDSAQRTAALLERVGAPALAARAAVTEGRPTRRSKPESLAEAAASLPPIRTMGSNNVGHEPPISFFAFVRQRTGRPPAAIAAAVGASVQFLMGLGRVGRVPARAAEALSVRVAEHLHIAVDETLVVLARGAPSAAFASSDTPDTDEVLDYATLVRMAKLTPEDEAFWASMAEDSSSHGTQEGAS